MDTKVTPVSYWPALIARDDRFDHTSIFLGGYYTSVDAGSYDVRHSADELFSALNRIDRSGNDPVLSKDNIIFICHSTGGIIIRHILVNHYEKFSQKKVGLILIASPSYGSRWADWLKGLTSLYGHAIGEQLQEGSWSLSELDAQFKTLIAEKRIPFLVGIEAYENHFIVHQKWLPNKSVVVTKESASRYFGVAVLLRKTDHFSSVKPNDYDHPAYELLLDFCQKHAEFGLGQIPKTVQALDEYLFVDEVRLDNYFSQIPGGTEAKNVSIKIARLNEYLETKDVLVRGRPEGRNVSEGQFVFESMSATKVIFPRALAASADLADLAVWVSTPIALPRPTQDRTQPDGTFLYLIETYRVQDKNGRAFSGPQSGFSALDNVLSELADEGAAMAPDQPYAARVNRYSPLEILKRHGGAAQRPRRIKSLYKPRYLSDDEYYVIGGLLSHRAYGLFAYPIFVAVDAP
jgi:hypothetical protein